jgi:hypothetical protein
MTTHRTLVVAVATVVLFATGASASHAGTGRLPVPAGLVTLRLDADSTRLWPWTGGDLSGEPSDPINLIFLGEADPRQVRQALLSVDGDRTSMGLPPVAPFNCAWRDAIGVPETSWAEAEGWTGNAIGLECGDYGGVRAHLRLFRHGGVTLGGAHFEVLITGTTTHEVLSWEFAEALVKGDLARGGFLSASPKLTPAITATPSWRTIRYQVFNGVPAALRLVLGLPTGNQTSDVPIPSDGRASVLRLYQRFEPEAASSRRDYIQYFDQIVPRPFCAAGPLDYVYVKGPLHFSFRVETDPSGHYAARFSATGALEVTPISPTTGQPTGATVPAIVSEQHHFFMTDRRVEASLDQQQSILTTPTQTLFQRLDAGHLDRYEPSLDCGPTP